MGRRDLVEGDSSREGEDPIRKYYETGYERERLAAGPSRIELARTKELLRRFLPPAPATIIDIGGGPGAYAAWLADQGYDVHLVDPVPRHVEPRPKLRRAAIDRRPR